MNVCKELVEMRLVFYFSVQCRHLSEGFVGKRL
jgi:hypothetical protein